MSSVNGHGKVVDKLQRKGARMQADLCEKSEEQHGEGHADEWEGVGARARSRASLVQIHRRCCGGAFLSRVNLAARMGAGKGRKKQHACDKCGKASHSECTGTLVMFQKTSHFCMVFMHNFIIGSKERRASSELDA